MDNCCVSKLLPLIAEAEINVIPNPLINIVLQGRHDTFPKGRDLTRVREMLAMGINVGWGQDCVPDPWYPLGTADMLDVAFTGCDVAQMTSPADMRSFPCRGGRSASPAGIRSGNLRAGTGGAPGTLKEPVMNRLTDTESLILCRVVQTVTTGAAAGFV